MGSATGVARAEPRAAGAAVGASANVFHASHPGQRPSQRSDSCPHAVQKKAVRVFAIGS
jgi:hypothetical protein